MLEHKTRDQRVKMTGSTILFGTSETSVQKVKF